MNVDGRTLIVAAAALIIIVGAYLLLNTHCISFLNNHACVIGN